MILKIETENGKLEEIMKRLQETERTMYECYCELCGLEVHLKSASQKEDAD